MSMSETPLDERQRLALYTASHKAMRVVVISIVVAMIVVNALYDDLLLFGIIAALAFIAMFSHWYYLRRLGVDRELESIEARDLLRRPFLSKRTLGSVLLAMALALSIDVGEQQGLDAGDLVSAVLFGLLMAWTGWWASRAAARQTLERDARQSDGEPPGQQTAGGIAGIIGRG